MIKAVLDVNVILSGLIRPEGPPGQLLSRWDRGEFELVTSPTLIDELRRVLTYPRIRKKIDQDKARNLLELLELLGHKVVDPETRSPVQCDDPDDDYLIAIALKDQAVLVSGDRHLTALRATIPVFSPAEFLDYLAAA
ncbi:MAG: putative toxin-antitoxin system toxin component, PIN family [Thermoleophilaceae bacterium]|nr:putative toxin-antitoxin system toxin component, PIN family [Thermoleophilaceae bacterium]